VSPQVVIPPNPLGKKYINRPVEKSPTKAKKIPRSTQKFSLFLVMVSPFLFYSITDFTIKSFAFSVETKCAVTDRAGKKPFIFLKNYVFYVT
jgi:hypothetical protein